MNTFFKALVFSFIALLAAFTILLLVYGNFQFSKNKKDLVSIFFITGTSGSGKSTLTLYLKTELPETLFEIYDFDENGVPANPDVAWRQETTNYWLTTAQKHSIQNKSTVICGVTVPSEILKSLDKPDLPLYFGFIKISDEVIQQRLEARGWSDQLILDNINWAHYLEAEVKKQEHHMIVDSSLDEIPEQTAREFIKWIYSSIKL